MLLTLLLCNLTVMLCACRQLPPFLLLLQVCTRTRHSCMCSSGFVCLTTSLAQCVALQGGVATDCYWGMGVAAMVRGTADWFAENHFQANGQRNRFHVTSCLYVYVLCETSYVRARRQKQMINRFRLLIDSLWKADRTNITRISLNALAKHDNSNCP